MEHCPSATTNYTPLCDACELGNSTPAIREAGSGICTQVEELDSLKAVRILLVDDSLPFRRFVREILECRRDFQVVGEASDGFEAVRQATQLKPDLILLDIGIPRLNGIAAARQIRQVVPGTKILFLTMNSDADVVSAALDTEAKGYVLKLDAASELWLAIEAVLHGKQYVSSGVGRRRTDSN